MKPIRIALLAFFSMILVIACKKEKSFESGYTGNLNAEWEFKEGKHYKGKVDTAYIQNFGIGIQALFIEGISHDGKEILSIQVINIDLTKPATYKTPNVLFTYLKNSDLIYANDILAAGEFELVVTRIDSASVSGTFNGKVKDSTGTLKTVTEGKFAAKLKKAVAPPVGSGSVIFWAKEACTSGGNITVKLSNNQTGTISTFTATEPTCGATGMASFTLPPGNYSWKAYCGSQDSTSGTITVVANQCVKTQCNFAVLPTNCKLSTIGYYFMPGMTLDGAVNSFFTGTQITSIQVYDSASATIYNDFPVTYSTGKIKFGNDQIFTLNANGTVAQYDGFLVPFDNSTDSVIAKYEYDANGYMIKRSLFIPVAPTIPILESVYTWVGGNMTKIVNTLAITNERWETEIQYNNARSVKSFLNFQFLAYELLQFQTAINTGKQSNQVPVSATTKYYENNVLKSTDVSNFINYVIDDNSNYVKSFEITGADYDSYLYWGSEKYVLGYKCF